VLTLAIARATSLTRRTFLKVHPSSWTLPPVPPKPKTQDHSASNRSTAELPHRTVRLSIISAAVMSWLGIDLAGNARFVSGDGSWETEELNEEEEDVTAPPPVTEVDTAFGDTADEVSSYGGITILSSAPSTELGQGQEVSRPLGGITGDFPSMEVSEVDTASRLSLHPSSINSSIMTQSSLGIPRTVSVDSSEDDDDESMEPLPRTQQVEREQTEEPSTEDASTSIDEGKLKVWYGRLETEQDWDDFRHSAMELLNAIESSSENNQDALLSELILAEEEYFWGPKPEAQRNWLLDAAAIAGTVAFATVAAVRILKGR